MSKIIFLTFLFLLMAILPINSSEYHEVGEIPNICTLNTCQERVKNSEMTKFCVKSNSSGLLSVRQSCCLNHTGMGTDIIGLDLSSCGLYTVTGRFSSCPDVKVLMLENNAKLKLHEDDFKGLAVLEYLSLPLSTKECPGGNKSWEVSLRTDVAVVCKEEINLCQHDNVTMTCENSNSECVLVGPGDIQCLCKPGYYGYKCLRQGTFPTVVYTAVLCGLVVALSAFLWCTQRRRIKSKSHFH